MNFFKKLKLSGNKKRLIGKNCLDKGVCQYNFYCDDAFFCKKGQKTFFLRTYSFLKFAFKCLFIQALMEMDLNLNYLIYFAV